VPVPNPLNPLNSLQSPKSQKKHPKSVNLSQRRFKSLGAHPKQRPYAILDRLSITAVVQTIKRPNTRSIKMKLILILSALLLLCTASAFSELTADDLEKINEIVIKSEKRLTEEIADVEEKVAASEKRLTEDIAGLKQELKADIAQEVGKVSVKIEERGKSLNYIFAMVIALVALIAVAVGIPQIIVAMQRKDISAQDKKIEALQQEIETRNPERIVRP
jgi:predicted PurR-regulated permease PerM